MKRLRTWFGAPVGIAVTTLVLFTMVTLAMRTGGAFDFDLSGPNSKLEYSAPPFGAFFPLRSPFVEETLGRRVFDYGSPRGTDPRSDGRKPSDPTTVTHTLTNDDIADAYEIASIPFTARSNSSRATRERNEPSGCSLRGGSVWYRYQASSNATLVASTAAGGPVSLSAFVQPVSQSSRTIACGSSAQGKARVSFVAFAGTTYFFRVAHEVAGGRLVFSLERENRAIPASSLPNGGLAGADFDWGYPRVSANGRFVGFTSDSNELDPRCKALASTKQPCGAQAYVRDLVTGTTELVSVTAKGDIPNAQSRYPQLSADGRYVVFQSTADNFGPEPDAVDPVFGTPEWDIFLRDRLLRRTTRVTIAADGSELNGAEPSISDNGRYVAFDGDFEHRATLAKTATVDVYVKDLLSGTLTRVSDANSGARGNHDSINPHISPDGGFVAFWSRATNLSPYSLAGADELAYQAGIFTGRVYVYDMHKKTLTDECVADDGTPSNSHCYGQDVSAGGRYSVFWSTATNLLPGIIEADTYQMANLYLRDRATGKLELVNVGDDGTAYPERFDLQTGLLGTRRLLQPVVSADGTFVAFDSSEQLAAGDTSGEVDAYVRDRVRGRTIRVSRTVSGGNANDWSIYPTLSGDGSLIAFLSLASNLAPNDTNKEWDVFVCQWRDP